MPIKNIYIIGNELLTDEVVMDEAHLDSYPSFLLTSSNKVKNELKRNKFIDTVKIKKRLGNILEIKIKEYKVIASNSNGDSLILSSGEIVPNVYNITDVSVLNNNMPDDVRKIFSEKFNKVNKNILRQISQIEYSPVKVDEERFLLYMDDGNLVYITLTKINKLNKYNKIRDKLSGKMGVIYLDFGDFVEFKDNKVVIDNKNKNEKNI